MSGSVELLYERAYAQYSKDVFRFLVGWTNDWAAAEELTHDTFVRLWQHRSTLDWSRPMLPWLLVTGRRLASNRLRALRRRARRLEPVAFDDEQVRVQWLDVRRALDRLTAIERTAVILTTVEGWTYREAAALLETTDGALRSAVSRAREKLENS